MAALPESSTHRRPTVCLIEDHAGVREELIQLLTSNEIDVIGSVATFREGRQAVEELMPDIAVIDNRLPDGRGIDLCRRLHDTFPDVRVLVHTGTLTFEDEREAFEAGAAAVISKSVRGADLLEAIRANAPTQAR
jgi:DNA-binding NarL/FixJ family response regulator